MSANISFYMLCVTGLGSEQFRFEQKNTGFWDRVIQETTVFGKFLLRNLSFLTGIL